MAGPVIIGICTSSKNSNIAKFLAEVSSLPNVAVRFIQLPFNNLDNFNFPTHGLDGVIICHSTSNRGLAPITDGLYDNLLLHLIQVFGSSKICVIVNDYVWDRVDQATVLATYNETLARQQSQISECSSLFICGTLDGQEMEMDNEYWRNIQLFIHQCRAHNESQKHEKEDLKNDWLPWNYLLAVAGGITFMAVVAFEIMKKKKQSE